MTRKPKKGVKVTAFFLAFIFLFSETARAAPLVAPAVVSPLEALLLDPHRIETPSKNASLQDVHRGTSGRLFIHIQDAHANLSGQKNLAGSLEMLIKRYGISLVLVEGGTRDVTLTSLKGAAPQEAWNRVAKSFLMDAKISGEEYLNLVSDLPMKIVGVEDKALYFKSLETYAKLAQKREATLGYLARIRRAVDTLKRHYYPRILLNYEKRAAALGTADHVALTELAASASVDLANYPNVEALTRLSEKEKSIDFSLANLEQAALVEEITKRGGTNELTGLLAGHDRSDKLSQLAYFRNTFLIAEKKRITVSQYPNLQLYKTYLEDFASIQLDAVFEESLLLEDTTYLALLKDETARLLRAVDRHTAILETAYRIQMTTKEFSVFAAEESDFTTTATLAFLNTRLAEKGYAEDLIEMSPELEDGKKALYAFYDSVQQRDFAFLANAEKVMQSENARAAVLVTGGYHTPHLKKLFREAGHSYVVLTPFVSGETNQAKYEKRLLATLKVSDGPYTIEKHSRGPAVSDVRQAPILEFPGGRDDLLAAPDVPTAKAAARLAGGGNWARKAWSEIKAELTIHDPNVAHLTEGFLPRLYHALETTLDSIARKIDAGVITPDVSFRSYSDDSNNLFDDTVLTGKKRGVRVGILPLAGNPVHWGHILIALMAMDRMNLDTVLFRIQGKIAYKKLREADRVPEEDRYAMTGNGLRQLFPMLRLTDIGLGNDIVGELNAPEILKMNPKQNMTLVYLSGSENEDRLRRIANGLHQGAKDYKIGSSRQHNLEWGVIQRAVKGDDFGDRLDQNLLDRIMTEVSLENSPGVLKVIPIKWAVAIRKATIGLAKSPFFYFLRGIFINAQPINDKDIDLKVGSTYYRDSHDKAAVPIVIDDEAREKGYYGYPPIIRDAQGNIISQSDEEAFLEKLRPISAGLAKDAVANVPDEGGLVSLDGPSGSGKSTIARQIVEEAGKLNRRGVVIGLDIRLKDRMLRHAIQKLVVGEKLYDNEIQAIQTLGRHGIVPNEEYLKEEEFFENAAIEADIHFKLKEFFKSGQESMLLKVNNVYDQETKEVKESVEYKIHRGDIVIIEGKFANLENFSPYYVRRYRLSDNPDRVMARFEGRTRRQSPDSATRQMVFYRLALGPSYYKVYAPRTEKALNLVADISGDDWFIKKPAEAGARLAAPTTEPTVIETTSSANRNQKVTFTLTELIHRGSDATLYKALRSDKPGNWVFNEIQDEEDNSWQPGRHQLSSISRFSNEASRIPGNHPNAVLKRLGIPAEVYEPEFFDAQQGQGWLGNEKATAVVYQYIPGLPLDQYFQSPSFTGLSASERLSRFLEVFITVAQTADVLNNESHIPGVWDLNLRNVIVGEDGRLHFIDYLQMKVTDIMMISGMLKTSVAWLDLNENDNLNRPMEMLAIFIAKMEADEFATEKDVVAALFAIKEEADRSASKLQAARLAVEDNLKTLLPGVNLEKLVIKSESRSVARPGAVSLVSLDPEEFIKYLPKEQKPKEAPWKIYYLYRSPPNEEDKNIFESLVVIYGEKEMPELVIADGLLDYFTARDQSQLQSLRSALGFVPLTAETADSLRRGSSFLDGAMMQIIAHPGADKAKVLRHWTRALRQNHIVGHHLIVGPGQGLEATDMDEIRRVAIKDTVQDGPDSPLSHPVVGVSERFGGIARDTGIIGAGMAAALVFLAAYLRGEEKLFTKGKGIVVGFRGFTEKSRATVSNFMDTHTSVTGINIQVIAEGNSVMKSQKEIPWSYLRSVNAELLNGTPFHDILDGNTPDGVEIKHLAPAETSKMSAEFDDVNILILDTNPRTFSLEDAKKFRAEVIMEAAPNVATQEAIDYMKSHDILFIPYSTVNIARATLARQEIMNAVLGIEPSQVGHSQLQSQITERTLSNLLDVFQRLEDEKRDLWEFSEMATKMNLEEFAQMRALLKSPLSRAMEKRYQYLLSQNANTNLARKITVFEYATGKPYLKNSEKLTDNLSSPDPMLRRSAAYRLGSIPKDLLSQKRKKPIVKRLGESLLSKNEYYRVRANAARALGRLGGKPAVYYLKKAYFDPNLADPTVRQWVEWGLRENHVNFSRDIKRLRDSIEASEPVVEAAIVRAELEQENTGHFQGVQQKLISLGREEFRLGSMYLYAGNQLDRALTYFHNAAHFFRQSTGEGGFLPESTQRNIALIYHRMAQEERRTGRAENAADYDSKARDALLSLLIPGESSFSVEGLLGTGMRKISLYMFLELVGMNHDRAVSLAGALDDILKRYEKDPKAGNAFLDSSFSEIENLVLNYQVDVDYMKMLLRATAGIYEDHQERAAIKHQLITQDPRKPSPGSTSGARLSIPGHGSVFSGYTWELYEMQGGMSKVYLGVSPSGHKILAKIAKQEELQAVIEREGSLSELLASEPTINHLILALIGRGSVTEADKEAFNQLTLNEPYLIREKANGNSLAYYIIRTKSKVSKPIEAIEILAEIAHSLAILHSPTAQWDAVYHGGLKKQDIFIEKKDSSWRVQFVDWGLGTIEGLKKTHPSHDFSGGAISKNYIQNPDIEAFTAIVKDYATAVGKSHSVGRFLSLLVEQSDVFKTASDYEKAFREFLDENRDAIGGASMIKTAVESLNQFPPLAAPLVENMSPTRDELEMQLKDPYLARFKANFDSYDSQKLYDLLKWLDAIALASREALKKSQPSEAVIRPNVAKHISVYFELDPPPAYFGDRHIWVLYDSLQSKLKEIAGFKPSLSNVVSSIFSDDKDLRDGALDKLGDIQDQDLFTRHFVPGAVEKVARFALKNPGDGSLPESAGEFHAVAAAIDPENGVSAETLAVFQNNALSPNRFIRRSALRFLQFHENVSMDVISAAIAIYLDETKDDQERHTAGFLLAHNAVRVQRLKPGLFKKDQLFGLSTESQPVLDALIESLLPPDSRQTYRYNAVIYQLASIISMVQKIRLKQFPLTYAALYRHLYNQFQPYPITLAQASSELERIARETRVDGARLVQEPLTKAEDTSSFTKRLFAGVLISNPYISESKFFSFLSAEGEKKSITLVRFSGGNKVTLFHAKEKDENGEPLLIGELSLDKEIESLLKERLEVAYRIPVKEDVIQAKSPKALEALTQERATERLAAIAWKKGPPSAAQNKISVVLRVTTMKKLKPEEIKTYWEKLETIRAAAGPNVYLEFFYHEGESFVSYVPNETPEFGEKDEFKIMYIAELTPQALTFAKSTENTGKKAGILVFDAPDDDDKGESIHLRPIVGQGFFAVLSARLKKLTDPQIQLWKNLRQDPLFELDEDLFQRRVLNIDSVKVSDYIRLKLRAITKLNLEDFLEYQKLTQAIDRSA